MAGSKLEMKSPSLGVTMQNVIPRQGSMPSGIPSLGSQLGEKKGVSNAKKLRNLIPLFLSATLPGFGQSYAAGLQANREMAVREQGLAAQKAQEERIAEQQRVQNLLEAQRIAIELRKEAKVPGVGVDILIGPGIHKIIQPSGQIVFFNERADVAAGNELSNEMTKQNMPALGFDSPQGQGVPTMNGFTIPNDLNFKFDSPTMGNDGVINYNTRTTDGLYNSPGGRPKGAPNTYLSPVQTGGPADGGLVPKKFTVSEGGRTAEYGTPDKPEKKNIVTKEAPGDAVEKNGKIYKWVQDYDKNTGLPTGNKYTVYAGQANKKTAKTVDPKKAFEDIAKVLDGEDFKNSVSETTDSLVLKDPAYKAALKRGGFKEAAKVRPELEKKYRGRAERELIRSNSTIQSNKQYLKDSDKKLLEDRYKIWRKSGEVGKGGGSSFYYMYNGQKYDPSKMSPEDRKQMEKHGAKKASRGK